MDTIQYLQIAQETLAPWTERVETPEDNRVDFYLPAEKIVEAVQAVVNAGGWHLSAMTGMDIPQAETIGGEIEMLYHFCQSAAVVTLRIRVPYSMPFIPSICDVIPPATLYEREAIEMFGVNFEGTPSRERLLLPDDWPEGVFPLRKSFKGLE